MYYGPGESTGRLLQELAEDLAGERAITVIAKEPDDKSVVPPEHPGIDVHWVRGTRLGKSSLIKRLIDYVTFLLACLPALVRVPRPDAVLCMTNPPFIGLAGALTARLRGAALIVTMQDVHPDIGIVSGRLDSKPLVYALRWVQRFFFRHADRLIAISEGMKGCLVAKGASPEKVAVIPNWVDIDEIEPHQRRNPWAREQGLNGRFTLMHAGNVGLLQSLETLVEAAPRVPEVDILIVGDGAAKPDLQEFAGQVHADNVRFIDRQPRERLPEVLAAADAHLVSLRRGLVGLMEPCKVYGVMAAARPTLAAIEPESEPGRIVQEVGCGVLVEPDDVDALVSGISELARRNSVELREMGEAARAYAEAECVRSRATKAYRDVLASVGA
jgi:glycosyltransferase involved in cell wall biosynthesis